MFKAIKEFFFGKPAVETAAPYKVEAPAPTVVVDASLDSKPQVSAVAPSAVTKPARKPRANVAAKKIAAAKKPAAPRKPRAPTA